MAVGLALTAVAVIALVGLGFLTGRGPAEARRIYLFVVSGASLLVLALAVITALFGVVEIALPGSVGGAGGRRPAVVRSFGVGPMVGARDGLRIQVPGTDNNGGAPMVAPMPRMGRIIASPAKSVRSEGIVRLLRGIIVALVAGAVFGYHWPLASEAPAAPPAEAGPTPSRRRRTSGS
jgi:hypothetical protein